MNKKTWEEIKQNERKVKRDKNGWNKEGNKRRTC